MRGLIAVGLIATVALTAMYGCDENERPSPAPHVGGHDHGPGATPSHGQTPNTGSAGEQLDEEDDDFDFDDDDFNDETDFDDDGGAMEEELGDAGVFPASPVTPGAAPQTPAQGDAPRTPVPDEFVGAWDDGALNFETWENYREGYWGGRDASASREAMVFNPNGDAKFYRYEFARNLYEELIDCEGTVAFHEDGTFTFYPIAGRKRFFDSRYSENNVNRALTAAELTQPKLAGTRGYVYDPSNPDVIQIIVPGSAPYNWYRKR